MEGTLADFVQLSGVGLAGVVSWGAYKLVSNHLVHSTKALVDLTEVIKELKEFLQFHKNNEDI